MIIRVPLPYNVILGCPEIKQLGSIASTLHSIMKFPTQDGIAVVRRETPELIYNHISRKRDRSSEEDQFQNEKNDEEMIVINEAYPEQKVTIGKNLPRRLKQQLSGRLRSNIDIFAWTPADMNGIPHESAEHRLNIHPRTFFVWQKKRVLAKERNDAITQEERRLLHLRHSGNIRNTKKNQHETKSKEMHVWSRKWTVLRALNGKLAALGHLLSKSAERSLTIFSTLKGPELNYPSLEKVALALVNAARRLRRYFQSHKIYVLTDQPIRRVLLKPEDSGRLAKWAIELGEHEIIYKPRSAIKGQILVDFLIEPPRTEERIETKYGGKDSGQLESTASLGWILLTDGASGTEGSRAGLVITNPNGQEITYALRFNFKISNNEAGYEALIAGLKLAIHMEAQHLQVFSDSLLFTNQDIPFLEHGTSATSINFNSRNRIRANILVGIKSLLEVTAVKLVLLVQKLLLLVLKVNTAERLQLLKG
ncbi:reverse transcriptase domain-containing protein [Tanacetum coccineum]